MKFTKKQVIDYWDEEIVIPTTKNENQIIIKVDYPLDTAFYFYITKDKENGFTRSRLQHEISEIYNKIFKESFKNKNEIWKLRMYSHSLGDLVLRDVMPRCNGDIHRVRYWELNFDS
jgi:hypothetical protein